MRAKDPETTLAHSPGRGCSDAASGCVASLPSPPAIVAHQRICPPVSFPIAPVFHHIVNAMAMAAKEYQGIPRVGA